MRQYSISILKKEWAKYRGYTYFSLVKKSILPREDMYDTQVLDEIPDDIQTLPDLINRFVQPWADRKMFRTINGIILEINENGISTAYYLEEKIPVTLPDYYMAPDDIIGRGSLGIHISGYSNESWSPFESINLDGKQIFLLDSERFPNTHEYLVVTGKCQVIMQTMNAGFSDTLIAQIREKISLQYDSSTQTMAMGNGYGKVKANGKYEKISFNKPDNYDSLSLREKIEVQKSLHK